MLQRECTYIVNKQNYLKTSDGVIKRQQRMQLAVIQNIVSLIMSLFSSESPHLATAASSWDWSRHNAVVLTMTVEIIMPRESRTTATVTDYLRIRDYLCNDKIVKLNMLCIPTPHPAPSEIIWRVDALQLMIQHSQLNSNNQWSYFDPIFDWEKYPHWMNLCIEFSLVLYRVSHFGWIWFNLKQNLCKFVTLQNFLQ